VLGPVELISTLSYLLLIKNENLDFNLARPRPAGVAPRSS